MPLDAPVITITCWWRGFKLGCMLNYPVFE
jgi:hypothetical protein